MPRFEHLLLLLVLSRGAVEAINSSKLGALLVTIRIYTKISKLRKKLLPRVLQRRKFSVPTVCTQLRP